MTGNQPPESIDLYAALTGRGVADILNATTRPTRREDLLGLFMVAICLEGNNGELRFPRALLDQAAVARRPPPTGQGRRLEGRFDSVTFEYVLNLTRPEQLGQQQLETP
jgi:hypothetical protein